MDEFVVIVESSADAETATKLAERILAEKIEWLEPEQLQYLFRWSGLQEGTEYSCWKNVKQIIDFLTQSSNYKPPRYLGHSQEGALKADGAIATKVLGLVRFLQGVRSIKAVLLIRDLDDDPERRQGLEQARARHSNQQTASGSAVKLEIVIGTADRMREAWVLNGFIPFSKDEERILQEIKTELAFDPCEESHRLRSNSRENFDRIRNPKVVLKRLTQNDRLREQQCWEATDLEIL